MIMLTEMKAEHVPQVAQLEKTCFADPWSEMSIAHELESIWSYWLVAVDGDTVAGYIGSQSSIDESDIMNVAVHPDYRRQGIAEALINSGAVDIIVLDSVAALVPQQEIEGGMGDSHMGVQARLMSQALRKLAGAINKTNCILIFINQLRSKIGVMYGNPETTTGGNALKFYASVRIDIRKSETLKNGSEAYGNRVKAKVVKNKVAPPFKVAEFEILYGSGISKSTEIVDMAIELGIVEKSGSFFTYGETKIQGKDKMRAHLEASPDIMAELEEKIKAKLANGEAPEAEDDILDNDEFDLSALGLED